MTLDYIRTTITDVMWPEEHHVGGTSVYFKEYIFPILFIY
jgi:hypothetical protein